MSDDELEALAAPWVYIGMAFPSTKDVGWSKERPELASVSTAIAIAEVPCEWFTSWDGTRVHARGAQYEKLKSVLQKKLLAALVQRFPSCEGHIKSVSSGTPLSTQYYLNKPHGESYGLRPTPKLFENQDEWLQPRLGGATSPGEGIDGLYIAGQDVNFDGFAGATLGGIMCAAAIDGIGVWLDIAFRAIGIINLVKDLVFGGPDLTEQYRYAWSESSQSQPRVEQARSPVK